LRAIERLPSPLAVGALVVAFALCLLVGRWLTSPSGNPVDRGSGDSHAVTMEADRNRPPLPRHDLCGLIGCSGFSSTFSTSTGRGERAIRVPVSTGDGHWTFRQLDVRVGRAAARCWAHPLRPYEYDDQSDNPFCRVTVAGGVEHALSARVSYGRGGRVLTERLRPGRHPIVDSFGRPFGYFKQVGFERFRIYDQSGRLYGTSGREAVAEVQGRGCMVTNAMENRYVILVLRAPDFSIGIGPRGDHRDVGARGFVQRSVLPPGIFHRANPSDSANNDTVIDSVNSGCGAPLPHASTSQPATPFAKPLYSSADRYQGAKRHCPSPFARTCGGHYWDYSRPRFAADVVALTSASTGVRNGGIVRAWVRTSKPWRLVDAIGYADPNVPCGQRPVAQWLRVDANPYPRRGQNHIFGWFPQAVRGQPERRC
jgi:hypothetical protein